MRYPRPKPESVGHDHTSLYPGRYPRFLRHLKKRLIEEIKELRDRVDKGNAPLGVQHDTVDAIDHVRSIGNIGAHMEADIDVIVDVDPEEAQKLIELVELLFDEWYAARERRQQRLAELGVIAAQKKALQQQAQLPAPTQPATAQLTP